MPRWATSGQRSFVFNLGGAIRKVLDASLGYLWSTKLRLQPGRLIRSRERFDFAFPAAELAARSR